MRVLAEFRSRVELDARLDGFASGGAEIVPLEIGALDSRLLRPRRLQRQAYSCDQHGDRDDVSRFHMKLLSSFKRCVRGVSRMPPDQREEWA
jgi:hypothetical protein